MEAGTTPPVVVVVHPEVAMAQAVCLQLNRAFGPAYRFAEALDLEAAYELLADLEAQQVPVPLLLVYQAEAFQFLTSLVPQYRSASCLVIDREHHEELAQLIDHHGIHAMAVSNAVSHPTEFIETVGRKLRRQPQVVG